MPLCGMAPARASESTAISTPGPSADLSITKEDGREVAILGQTLTYTLTVRNTGPDVAGAGRVEDLLPPDLVDARWTCRAQGGAACGGNPFGIVGEVEPNDGLPGAQNLDGEAWSLAPDPLIGDKTENTSTSIPHLSVLGTGNSSFDFYSFTVPRAGVRGIFDIDFGTGGTGYVDSYLFLYDSAGELLAVNDDAPTSWGQGGSSSSFDSFIELVFPAPGLYVIAVGRCCVGSVPAGADYRLQISLAGHGVGQAGDVVEEAFLPPGGSLIYTITGRVDPDATGTLANTATVVDPSTTDPDPTNNAATDVDALLPAFTALKDVSGSFQEGGRVTYTVRLINNSEVAQKDHPGPEFVDPLPAQLRILGASADRGLLGIDTTTNILTWDGPIPGGDVLTILIEAEIRPGTLGQTVANQGSLRFFLTGDATDEAIADPATNEVIVLTSDPVRGGPTRFTVGSILEIPTLGTLGLLALALALALSALALLRRLSS